MDRCVTERWAPPERDPEQPRAPTPARLAPRPTRFSLCTRGLASSLRGQVEAAGPRSRGLQPPCVRVCLRCPLPRGGGRSVCARRALGFHGDRRDLLRLWPLPFRSLLSGVETGLYPLTRAVLLILYFFPL